MKNKLLAMLGAGLLVGSPATALALTVFDVTATGYVCTYNADGSCNYQNTSFTGTVTIDVGLAGPSYSDGPNNVYGDFWVATTFQLVWAGGTYTSGLVPGGVFSSGFTRVVNDYPLYGTNQDILESSFYSSLMTLGATTVSQHQNQARLDRRTVDLSWLSSVDFIESAGLAPGGLNYIYFADYVAGFDYATNQSTDWFGFMGYAFLDSMTPRTSVPEPGTLALLGLGLAGLGFCRRKRLN